MGSFYANIAVLGAPQADVVELLTQLGRTAYVSPEHEGVTVVCDKECDSFMEDPETLAATLSSRLSCGALSFLNHDDDVLVCAAVQDGEVRARYGWATCEDFLDLGETCPLEEFAEQVGAMISRDVDVARLMAGIGPDRSPVFAFELHAMLAEAFGLGPYTVGYGFGYIEAGDVPEADAFVMT